MIGVFPDVNFYLFTCNLELNWIDKGFGNNDI